MCSNVEKARYLKILVAEIRAEIAKRKAARKAGPAPAKPAWAQLLALRAK